MVSTLSGRAWMERGELTGVADGLVDRLGLGALAGLGGGLGLEGAAGVARALGVHGALQGVALPAEEVITVQTEAGLVGHAPEEGLRAILGPLGLVVEARAVEHDFVHNL